MATKNRAGINGYHERFSKRIKMAAGGFLCNREKNQESTPGNR
jgi:hypothetical protein